MKNRMLGTFGGLNGPLAIPGEERRSPRLPAALPVMLATSRRDHPALLVDVAPEGAKVACIEPLAVGTLLILKSGSIRAAAIVVWGEDGRYGLEFDPPLTMSEVAEHFSRSDAMLAYNQGRPAS
jgi:hypothetical protein